MTVDHISRGRLILGLGAGWHEGEHRHFGIELPPPAERVDRLEEAIQVIRALSSRDRVDFVGRHYRLDDATLEPKPIQSPIPLLIAAHRPRMIRLAARYADQWDTFPRDRRHRHGWRDRVVEERVRRFDAAALDAGRDPSTIRRSTWAEAEAMASEDAYAAFVRTHARLGFTDFMTVLPPAGADAAVEAIAGRLIPAPATMQLSRAGTIRPRGETAFRPGVG